MKRSVIRPLAIFFRTANGMEKWLLHLQQKRALQRVQQKAERTSLPIIRFVRRKSLHHRRSHPFKVLIFPFLINDINRFGGIKLWLCFFSVVIFAFLMLFVIMIRITMCFSSLQILIMQQPQSIIKFDVYKYFVDMKINNFLTLSYTTH